MAALDGVADKSVTSVTPPIVQSGLAPVTKGELWHPRLGHPGKLVYDKLAKEIGLAKYEPSPYSLCSTCVTAKGQLSKGVISDFKATAPLQLVQVDLCGGFRYEEYVDSKCFLTIRDSYSRYYFVIPLKNKAAATQALINWIHQQENYFSIRGGYKVGTVRTDNGGEFTSNVLHDFFGSKGITHQLTVTHNSSQNGAVERVHRTLQEKMRSLLIGGRVPPYLWSEALRCAAYLLNRLPILSRQGSVPYAQYYGGADGPLRFNNLRTFGCAAFATHGFPNDTCW
ncbi:uncharacterized protein KNAG_0C06675 [Huiozyma naganishii CBS 8797]|uniref:Integrase catalytic domain-containing protein n=1 Tax=Huiozyma naganishii (strain ATCC MYA-139 / BCRC 22969 / CBS 8797 / KCTC 17520 / NBRC 10181 / NCYC 3082 / Yp74L-3) TaxID=1071383 RepID=J7R4I5_HUIN7|nr:hypothetical protein KNAG_0C06675 [Kazachstania naganishii CBS 8797]CCK69760.1 hypothetical protein KNAG_0C06675 [Kazachstania naganishii CBS 8797]